MATQLILVQPFLVRVQASQPMTLADARVFCFSHLSVHAALGGGLMDFAGCDVAAQSADALRESHM